ncbi:MAG: AgmX/PglI C-terminal domain-containing protein [Pseudomonadota bacterium]
MKGMRWLPFLFLLTFCTSTPEEMDQEATEQVDRKGIRKTMLAHRKYIGNCYGKTLVIPGNEDLKGTMTVQFNIGPDGRAREAKVVPERSSLQNPDLSRCLIKGLSSWDFPSHPQGIEVSVFYPFIFRANPPPNMQKKLDLYEKLKTR